MSLLIATAGNAAAQHVSELYMSQVMLPINIAGAKYVL